MNIALEYGISKDDFNRRLFFFNKMQITCQLLNKLVAL